MPSCSSRALLPILVLCWTLLSNPGLGIGTRHDVEERLYLELARNGPQHPRGRYPDFRAVGAVGIRGVHPEQFELLGSGTLLSPRWVLTAAHVVISKQKKHGDFYPSLYVRFGPNAHAEYREHRVIGAATVLPPKTLRILHGAAWHTSEKRLVTAEFHDLALLELEVPVQAIPPLPYCRREFDHRNLRVYLAGYGHSATGNVLNAEQWSATGRRRAAENTIDRDITRNPYTGKQQGGIILLDFDDGTEEHNTLNRVERAWAKLFGMGASDAQPLPLEGAAYPGDSGGPAIAKVDGVWQVVGVSGYGTGYPPDKRDSTISYGDILVYTRVASHQEWIASVLQRPAM